MRKEVLVALDKMIERGFKAKPPAQLKARTGASSPKRKKAK